MQIHEFVDEGLGHSSYVIDLDNGTAAVVDPPRFPMAHEHVADQLGVRLTWTIDSHSHADYVTGSPGLAARRDAISVAPAASNLATSHHPAVDGQVIELAPEITLTAMATPGHTPDHHAYLLSDHDVERHVAIGGIVVDARAAAAFSAGYVPGSMSNTLRPVFAGWLGWLVGK